MNWNDEYEGEEYVIASWGGDDRETEVRTVWLPSREVTAQLEVPVDIIESMEGLAEEHDLPVEQVLGERLELNLANVAVLTARQERDVDKTRAHLQRAMNLLQGVEELDTETVEERMREVWMQELVLKGDGEENP